MESGTGGGTARTDSSRQVGGVRRFTTETKASFKTSEFWLTIAVIVGILISAMQIEGGDSSGGDEFIARQAWLYVAAVASFYVLGRGLAKSRTPEPYTADSDDRS